MLEFWTTYVIKEEFGVFFPPFEITNNLKTKMEIFSIECEWLDNRVSTSTELANSHG
jgi:hypothetical protein